MATLVERMQGAAMLNIATYEEVEHDHTATGQAALVVVIAAIAQGIGSVRGGGGGIIGAVLGQLLGWALWAGLTYLVGTKLFGGTADWGELLRTLGFSQSPGVLYALAFIPVLGGLLRFVVGIWVLVAGVIAVRQALDVTTGKAVATVAVSAAIILVPVLLLGGALVAALGGAMAGTPR
jgi:hypothetical protein